METPTKTLIKAMLILACDIQSEDGVANAAIAEAANRLDKLEKENVGLKADNVLLRRQLNER